jgi:hypothetical protein
MLLLTSTHTILPALKGYGTKICGALPGLEIP